jgi:DNA relaxase NicK
MKIHWFSVTVFAPYEHALDVWQKFFELELGDLVDTARAGRGFQHISVALKETKLYYDPIPQKDTNLNLPYYYHLEFTGEGCECVIPTHFQDLLFELNHDGVLFRVTRLDVAWDGLSFTPYEFYKKIESAEVVTTAKRETLSYFVQPFDICDDGQIGNEGCYIGSRNSERFVRVYNKRGLTRFEIVYKNDRANAVSIDLFQYHYSDWDFVSREHVLDYINFPDWSLWSDFIKYAQQAELHISPARKVSLIKIEKWLYRQVSVALSVYYDVHGWENAQSYIDRMLFEAQNSRDRSRYKSILALAPQPETFEVLKVPEIHTFLDDIEFPSPKEMK